MRPKGTAPYRSGSRTARSPPRALSAGTPNECLNREAEDLITPVPLRQATADLLGRARVGSVRVLVKQPLHHRGVQIGSYLHDQSILKSNNPTVSIVEPHSVPSCSH